MKRNIFWLVMPAMVLALGMTVVGCDNDTANGKDGTFTLTGIPSEYNGKYAYLNAIADVTIYGQQSMTTTGLITLSPISNGSVSIPLWTLDTDYNLVRYSGNHTAGFVYVSIWNSQTPGIGVSDPSPIGSIQFSNVKFSNGGVTRAWSAGQYTAQ